jgi:hypothetical protein
VGTGFRLTDWRESVVFCGCDAQLINANEIAIAAASRIERNIVIRMRHRAWRNSVWIGARNAGTFSPPGERSAAMYRLSNARSAASAFGPKPEIPS